MPDPQLHDLAVKTADHLLQGAWEAVVPPEGHPGIYLHGPGQATLYLRHARRDRTRVAVSGHYPDSDVQPRSVVIKVAAARGPAALAAAIRARLLPDYLSELAKVLAHNRQRTQAAKRRRDNAAALATLLPGATVHEHGRDTTVVGWHPRTAGETLGEVSVTLSHDPQRAHLELRGVPVDLAEQIVRLIQQHLSQARASGM